MHISLIIFLSFHDYFFLKGWEMNDGFAQSLLVPGRKFGTDSSTREGWKIWTKNGIGRTQQPALPRTELSTTTSFLLNFISSFEICIHYLAYVMLRVW